MRTKLLYILVILLNTQTFGQRKSVADRYFKEFAYKKSAELYTSIYNKGDTSKIILERLGDSYYYNTETEDAEYWYSKLIENYSDEIEAEYYFRYAQVLKSNDKYDLSDQMLNKFRSFNRLDNRAEAIEESPDYLSIYSDGEDIVTNLHNLSINTEYSDYGGFLQGNIFYYASTKPLPDQKNNLYKWNNQPYYDLYSAISIELSTNSETKVIELEEEKRLLSKVNTPYHEASAIITKDGLTMYFTRDNFDGKKKGRGKDNTTHLKIYKAILVNGVWSNIEELPFNNSEYSIGHPALSPNERTLYFSSDMPGGFGGTDIYKVYINEDKTFGTPINLGNKINTPGREMFPYVSQDNVLYFSSDGHLGLGGLDIFESKINENHFSNVKNIEVPFNSRKDDFSFMVDVIQKKGFFTSNRSGGKGDDDIYSFILKDKPICKQTITGVVTNSKTGEILSNATVKLIDVNGVILKTVLSNSKGIYTFTDVSCNTTYNLLGEKVNYTSNKNKVNTTLVLSASQKSDLILDPLIIGNEIVINPIFFDFNKSNIRDEAAYELEKIVQVMGNNPNMIIRIESHTDSRGDRLYNRSLSDKRAKSTRDYIISRGITSSRISSAIGFGEDQLLNNCNDVNQNKCTEEEHQRNRRSKFIIINNKSNIKVTDPIVVPLKKIDPK